MSETATRGGARFEVFKSGEAWWWWRFVARNGHTMARSPGPFESRDAALAAVAAFQVLAGGAEVGE